MPNYVDVSEFDHMSFLMEVRDTGGVLKSFKEYTRVSGKVTAIILWTDDTKVKKIREQLLSYIGSKLDQTIDNLYEPDGLTIFETLTIDCVYSGANLIEEHAVLTYP